MAPQTTRYLVAAAATTMLLMVSQTILAAFAFKYAVAFHKRLEASVDTDIDGDAFVEVTSALDAVYHGVLAILIPALMYVRWTMGRLPTSSSTTWGIELAIKVLLFMAEVYAVCKAWKSVGDLAAIEALELIQMARASAIWLTVMISWGLCVFIACQTLVCLLPSRTKIAGMDRGALTSDEIQARSVRGEEGRDTVTSGEPEAIALNYVRGSQAVGLEASHQGISRNSR